MFEVPNGSELQPVDKTGLRSLVKNNLSPQNSQKESFLRKHALKPFSAEHSQNQRWKDPQMSAQMGADSPHMLG